MKNKNRWLTRAALVALGAAAGVSPTGAGGFSDSPQKVQEQFRARWGLQAETEWDAEHERDQTDPNWRGDVSQIVLTARDIMLHGRVNPFNQSLDWNNWCLGFVNVVVQDTDGQEDPQLAEPASAMASFYAMRAAGRMRLAFDEMPPGAAVYWANVGHGHVAIYSGRRDENGDPILITTTGWNGWSGIQELTMGALSATEVGPPSGWAKL